MRRNRQPFYHRIDGILFTATRSLPQEEVEEAIRKALKKVKSVIGESIEFEADSYGEPEPGDPGDLM